MTATYFDPGTRHSLHLKELRPNGFGLFEDMEAKAPTRIVCRVDSVDLYPRPARDIKKTIVLPSLTERNQP